MFWVISVYFSIRNTLPKSGTFLLGHPVYIYIYFFFFHAVLPVVIFVVSLVSAAAASQVRFSVIVFLVIMRSSKVRCRSMLLDCVLTKCHKSRLGSTGVEMSGARAHAHTHTHTHTHTHQHCDLRTRFPSFSRNKCRIKGSIRSR